MKINFYLFEGFETLDLFGPVEILCRVPTWSRNIIHSRAES